MPQPRRTPTAVDAPEDTRALDRWYVAGLICMLLLIVAFPVYNYGEPARRARAQAEMAQANVEIGRTMFAQHCASCQGDEARGGRGVPTLAAREFLSVVSDKQLHWLISGGVPGSAMTAYDIDLGGPFTSQEITRLAAYLRSLEEGAPSVAGWFKGEVAPPRHREQRRTTKQAASSGERGEHVGGRVVGAESMAVVGVASRQVMEVFVTRCAMCHGPLGQGSAIAPAIRPPKPALMAQPDRLFSIVARGVPGTAMQAFSNRHGGTLDETTLRDLVAWMQGTALR
ncbi:MAG: cytochrome c [Gemmatimonadaceae bacterium]|nr:cytochrome c [Gemmatimonadaceae bacterium]